MKLICSSCHQRWTPKRGQKRTASCPDCRRGNLSSAMVKAWNRRKVAARLEAATEALPEAGAATHDALAQLIRNVDAASAKALRAIESVSLPDPKTPRRKQD